MRTSQRFDGIDILRGLSILAVVLLHISLRMRFAGFSMQSSLPPWLFHLLFWNGNNGVTVFFAVSGFLITITSIRRFGSLAQMQVGSFYRFRFARIAPLLLLLLGVLSVLHLLRFEGFTIQPERSTLPKAIFAALTFHLNWLEAVHGYLPASWDVLWSLSVEEMFYAVFPLACLALFRFRHGTPMFIGLLVTFAVMGPLARVVWTKNEIWQEKSYLGGMDGIALGCATALLVHRLRRREANWRTRALTLAGCAMILLIAIWPRWALMKYVGRTGLDGTILAVGTCLVMIGTVLRGRVAGHWTAPIRWLGRHSYEVYLTHEFVVIWGTALYVKAQRGPLALWFVVIVLLSAGLGGIIARFFTEPLNRRLRGPARLEGRYTTG